MKNRWNRSMAPLIGIGAILLIWYGVCRADMFSAYVLPPPSGVFRSFYKMAVNGELWKDIFISFVRVAKGFSIAFVLAFGLGMVRILLPGTSGVLDRVGGDRRRRGDGEHHIRVWADARHGQHSGHAGL